MPDGGQFQRFAPDARPRVLLLLANLHGGGAERVAVHLLNRCDPAQLNVRMALIRRSGPYLAQVDEAQLDVSPVGHGLVEFEGHNSGFYRPDRLIAASVLAPVNAGLMVRRFRPDVVMSFLKGMNLVAYAARSVWGPRPPRWIAREGNNTNAVIDDEIGNRLGRILIKGAVRLCYRAADCVLANSHAMARGLEVNLGVERKRLRVIHNPIDVGRIQTAALEPMDNPPSRPFVITAGRLEYQKAHDLLLKAFASSPACHDLDLVILGKGSREAELKALARELGIAERVRFQGFVANPWSYFARARLFVLPSRWEGFPTVAAEALACGVPALVTDCEFGPSEIVEHGRSGWVAPTGDLQALTEAMDSILTNPLVAEMAARGRRSVLKFDIGAMVEAYTELFIEQAAERRSELVRIGALRLAEANS